MHLIVCIDQRDGMSFCGRRLSSDRTLTDYICKLTSESKLWMNAYSAKLFPETEVLVDESFLQKASKGEYCFAENTPLENLTDVESVTLCHWNRRYPSTEIFPRMLLANMHLVHTEEFPGNSHETLTIERYTL